MYKDYEARHINHVLALAANRVTAPEVLEKDALITQSWARCVEQYRLDPTQPQEARILPSTEVREHREMIEKFLRVARFGLEQLYHQVAGLGYVLLLTDKHGVTVDYIGDPYHEKELRQAGLYLGSDWNESHAGTCGVGTSLVAGHAFTCHQTDHFDATHIHLTCTAAPLYDPFGQAMGVLDISALHSPEPKSSQHMALQLVKLYGQRIEYAHFLEFFSHQWILRLSASPLFVEVDPEYLLALDNGGTIVGCNRRIHEYLGIAEPLPGRYLEEYFHFRSEDLPRLMETDDARARALFCPRTRQWLFVSVIVPKPKKPVSSEANRSIIEQLPKPLQQLGDGDPGLTRAIARAARLVEARVNILLTGETGTGKETVAHALHAAAGGAAKPFVAINCAALPESLIESELFGYTPGAFTGARSQGKRGLILEADGGTLFLDEIGDMPLALQARLLRVLAQREVQPIGASRPSPVELYVIAATHRNLKEMIAAGEFREDLYYRLNGFCLELPPLRERSDIRFLIDRILNDDSRRQEVPRLSTEALHALCAYDWPGNIRELRNALQFAVAVCSDSLICLRDLPDVVQTAVSDRTSEPTDTGQHLLEPAQRLLQVLQAHRWNITAVAAELGVARITVYRRMEKYGLVPPNQRG